MGGDHNCYYAQSLALIALALNDIFQEDVRAIFKPITEHVHSAPPKTYGRMFNKLMNPLDHGDPSIPQPRPARNVDVLRAGVEIHNVEDFARALLALKARFRILRIKNTHSPQVQGFGGYRSILANFA